MFESTTDAIPSYWEMTSKEEKEAISDASAFF
jgi:hypothetical protein